MIQNNPMSWQVGLVGYGEVGRILAEDLRKQGMAVSAYDLKLGTEAAKPHLDHAKMHGGCWPGRTSNLKVMQI